MVILSLDTTTRTGSYALMRDDTLCEVAGDASAEQTVRLPSALAELLARSGVGVREVDLLAVATGPGSFTGLRVGIATMQGLAMAIGVPLIGVSALHALAHAARAHDPSTRVATWMNAWRGDVYAALYDGERASESPVVAAPEVLLDSLIGSPVLFSGDGAGTHEDSIRTALGDKAQFTDPVAPLLAGAVAQLAYSAFLAGERPLPHAIRPLYVRRSEVERLSTPL
jgi:tRNA threonylcarbamoyladenosine biosynthesis protein TsaB